MSLLATRADQENQKPNAVIKKTTREAKDKRMKKKSQECMFCLVLCLVSLELVVWELLLPYVIHLLCGCRATHLWVLPLLTRSVTGKQTRDRRSIAGWWNEQAALAGCLGSDPLLYCSLARKWLHAWCPSFLTSEMEKVMTLFYRAIMKIKSDNAFFLPSILLSLIMAESGWPHMNGK